jgi:hypothetical protein
MGSPGISKPKWSTIVATAVVEARNDGWWSTMKCTVMTVSLVTTFIRCSGSLTSRPYYYYSRCPPTAAPVYGRNYAPVLLWSSLPTTPSSSSSSSEHAVGTQSLSGIRRRRLSLYMGRRDYSWNNNPVLQSRLLQLQHQQPSPQRRCRQQQVRCAMSVSGVIYDADEAVGVVSDDNDNTDHRNSNVIVVTLFTKEGCTLCDTVQTILYEMRHVYPHRLVAVDITDAEYRPIWYERYQYDIPVLHINGQYWTKHRITTTEAETGLQAVSQGQPFLPIGVEPDARDSRPRRK